MIGREVRTVRGEVGVVVQWEPLGASMCDVLVEHSDGRKCWHASHSLKSTCGGPLPTRDEARAEADAVATRQLQGILTQHVAKFHDRWPGAEHGKAIVGNAIVGALAEVKARAKP